MKTLIVDDERLARTEVRRLLEQHPDVEVVGEAANADEAEQRLSAFDIDLLLLDVQMPGATGFDLLERLDRVPIVVFTTAYDAYALRAFEVNAFDYLMKPIRPERLASALEKARGALLARQAADGARERPGTAAPVKSRSASDRIFIRDGDRCWIVAVVEIALIEAEGNYSRVHFGSNHPLIRSPLSALESRLDAAMFFRANRSQLFNLRFVEGVDTAVDDGLTVRLRTGQFVEVSRRQSRRLRESLSF
jgi:two-component system LytT family response regulator